ncbi:MAG: tRNA (guanosine(37)-N1)-methyltransferase TrmD [Verrucomicrobiae bacterium]|nr:tRNA (guanosine(37)-N1)-methyltransferase TrmD [Verrucomicrobiae bacterium]
MTIDILTLFPAMFAGPLDESIVRRARTSGILDLRIHNLREWTHDRHRTVDDTPYGGGPGMVLKPEPLFEAVEALKAKAEAERGPEARVILTGPAGRSLTQAVVRELSGLPRLILICGSYEGYDERVREHLADDEITIGDYVLTNGNLPAMVIVDAVTRLLPGALGDDSSSADESFSQGLLEYPQYTRPAEFRGWPVPSVLQSGNHAAIERWRRAQAVRKTALKRPDLWEQLRWAHPAATD